MLLTVEFNTEQEKEEIINQNLDKYLIEEKYLLSGNFLIFTNAPTLENKISILEAENENLKEGLRAVLRGDMQSLAYILYPQDFNTFQKVGV